MESRGYPDERWTKGKVEGSNYIRQNTWKITTQYKTMHQFTAQTVDVYKRQYQL